MRLLAAALALATVLAACSGTRSDKPAAAPASSNTDDLIRRLTSDDIAVRDRAQVELSNLSLERLRALEAAHDADAELKSRIRSAIEAHVRAEQREAGRREEAALLTVVRGEHRITVDLKDEPVPSAFDKILSPFGIKVEVAASTEELADWKVTLKLKEALLWDAVRLLCGESGALLTSGRATQPVLVFAKSGETPPSDLSQQARLFLEFGDAWHKGWDKTGLPLMFTGMFPPGSRPLAGWIVDLEVEAPGNPVRLDVTRSEITAWHPDLPKLGMDRYPHTQFSIGEIGRAHIETKELKGIDALNVSGNLLVHFPKEIRQARLDVKEWETSGFVKDFDDDKIRIRFDRTSRGLRILLDYKDDPDIFEMKRIGIQWEHPDGRRSEVEPDTDDGEPESGFDLGFEFDLEPGAKSLAVRVHLGDDVRIIPFSFFRVAIPKR